MILRLLDLRTLLTSQRVCREWCKLISTTKSLQTTLYFEPEEVTLSSRHRLINPLLRALFPRCFPVDQENIDADDLPLYFNINDDRIMREQASWRRMLISQPSIKKLGIYTRYVDFPTLDYCHSDVQTYYRGLRMEEYYTIIRKLADYKVLNLSVSWNVDEMTRQDFLDGGDIDGCSPDNWAGNVGYIFDLRAEVMIRKVYYS
ncbi:hypothetical protein B0O99DRAFT_640741 [Bisporella sp. PMI_857]|nr:hypothetical protein B0O99DRAFT_640741 [Bisporella sp. PMI_857]